MVFLKLLLVVDVGCTVVLLVLAFVVLVLVLVLVLALVISALEANGRWLCLVSLFGPSPFPWCFFVQEKISGVNRFRVVSARNDPRWSTPPPYPLNPSTPIAASAAPRLHIAFKTNYKNPGTWYVLSVHSAPDTQPTNTWYLLSFKPPYRV